MFQVRVKRVIGIAVALLALASMMGTAGALETESISVATAVIRVILGGLGFALGIAAAGGLEE